MFAMALWDRRERVLYLVRDRLGIKPLYWAQFGGLLLFGSELKALREHPGWQPALDRDALAGFLRFSYVPAPHTIYQGVNKLPPGTILVARAGAAPEIRPYLDARADRARRDRARVSSAARTRPSKRSMRCSRDAVGRRMIADVPLGAFLSGGIDSSTVVALMQAHKHAAGAHLLDRLSRDAATTRREHAAAVAAHLGTDHTELYVSPEHALTVIPQLPRCTTSRSPTRRRSRPFSSRR